MRPLPARTSRLARALALASIALVLNLCSRDLLVAGDDAAGEAAAETAKASVQARPAMMKPASNLAWSAGPDRPYRPDPLPPRLGEGEDEPAPADTAGSGPIEDVEQEAAPFYRTWWFWGAVGGALVLGVLLGSGGGGGGGNLPDFPDPPGR